ncbi:MAG: DUF1622 domain-containing protein [Gammaproteobacteria bacterium]|nr:DUF1622 domain-containing protein [Gammaproteobacteria bacterium]
MLTNFHALMLWIQHSISIAGVLIIVSGVLVSLYRYLYTLIKKRDTKDFAQVNIIRLSLARILLLGLEFIVAADLIGTTTAPDYYSVGILACIVGIRTILSYTLNKELIMNTKSH